MAGTEYPKIDTLYDRGEGHFVIVGKLKRQEFGNIKRWTVTEKLNGRNIRVSLFNNGIDGIVDYGGKTDEAEIPPELLAYLRKTFSVEKMKVAFWIDLLKIPQRVTIYGEGYGPGMTPGSGAYRKDVSFRLFDCLVDTWWLERPNLENVAEKLGIKCVPILGTIEYLPTTPDEIECIFKNNKDRLVAIEEGGLDTMIPEGIVAQSEQMLTNRKGERVMWKLKIKDFKREK